MINNYLKLSIRALAPIIDAEAFNRKPRTPDADEEPRMFVTSWIFPFTGSGKQALADAQEKRRELWRLNPTVSRDALQLATFAPSELRGVPVVGEPIRELKIVEAA